MNPNIPGPAAELLDVIADLESRGNYLAYFGHARNLTPIGKTVKEVLDFQHGIVYHGSKSSACGRYQFLTKTLTSLCEKYEIAESTAWTSDLQDLLAFHLLEERGYAAWIKGTLRDSDFADNLSKEWASLPYKTDKSFYDKDGLNHSLMTRATFMAKLALAKKTPVAQAPAPVVKPVPKEASMSSPIDIIAGVSNIVKNVIASVESSVQVVLAPNNSISVSGGQGVSGTIFSSISDAEKAVGQLKEIVADAEAGKWTEEPGDVIAFLKTVFSILDRFGVNVPVVSSLVKALPDLAPVAPPKTA